MMYIVKKSEDENIVVYDYYPENMDSDKGTVSVGLHDGARSVIKKSRDDGHLRYAGHAFYRIDRMIEEDDLLDKALVAWG